MKKLEEKITHQWWFDLPWHMVNLKDWFYMVNTGKIGAYRFLHVRVLGIRSTWLFNQDKVSMPMYMIDPADWVFAKRKNND